ncbi:GNAT family N-acetyltransferase [Kribbella sandramycini]|uniref:GNAT family N-acetyltransferase n=1 Tax=Kribbella sandramycini TaxID=60450 RepID=A0A7Y4P1M5_9ACTN|nr:GNAT superfamily N-acetyltransferase [Kribbella sandramycini]NOL42274.1 GNAT family N-acetyltransferase [Kribbella sandramycini]
MKWTHPGGFEADDDLARIDVDVVHGFLSTSYWATGIPRELVAQALAGSLNVGVYAADGALVAFARAVTDRTTFAWIADVFVLPEYQGHGLGKFVVATLLEHPELQGLRSMMLATNDAHELYRRHGFTEVDPGNVMALRHKPTDLYR